jgi:hypothetical protein
VEEFAKYEEPVKLRLFDAARVVVPVTPGPAVTPPMPLMEIVLALIVRTPKAVLPPMVPLTVALPAGAVMFKLRIETPSPSMLPVTVIFSPGALTSAVVAASVTGPV